MLCLYLAAPRVHRAEPSFGHDVQVDNWVYDEANGTFIDDPELQKRMMDLNPNSFRKLVATFLEANGRGYWEASEQQIDKLRQLYMDVEDKIEGVE